MGLRMDNDEGAIKERAEEGSKVQVIESPAPGGAETGEGIGVEGTACVFHSRMEDLAERDRVGEQLVPAGHPGAKAQEHHAGCCGSCLESVWEHVRCPDGSGGTG
eukprot:2394699-Rhodomonas_salina.1